MWWQALLFSGAPPHPQIQKQLPGTPALGMTQSEPFSSLTWTPMLCWQGGFLQKWHLDPLFQGCPLCPETWTTVLQHSCGNDLSVLLYQQLKLPGYRGPNSFRHLTANFWFVIKWEKKREKKSHNFRKSILSFCDFQCTFKVTVTLKKCNLKTFSLSLQTMGQRHSFKKLQK